jgi:hypothetical protein
MLIFVVQEHSLFHLYIINSLCRLLKVHTLSVKIQDTFIFMYRVRQIYLTFWQHRCEWNCWCGEFVFGRPSSETQSISVAMECWSVQHRAFAVETYFKNDSVVLTQWIFRRHFNIHRNNSVPSHNILYCCG